MMQMFSTREQPGAVIIEGHVQGLANARLLGKAGIPVVVVDSSPCVASHSRHCQRFYHCPDFASDAFAEFLLNLAETESLQNWILLPSNDHAVHTIARHKPRLSEHYRIITEDLAVIDQIYNKRELLSLALELGLPVPESVFPVAENPLRLELRYPVIIKGNNGLSFYKRYRQKAVIANSDRELAEVWNDPLTGIDPSEYFIQEVIPPGHKTVSVTVFAVEGTVCSHWMGVKLREHPVTFGTATCCRSVFDREMLDLSKQLIEKLGYTGVCEVEWLRDPRDGKPKLIEINARTWLWVGLAAKCGINYPLMIHSYLTNSTIPHAIEYPAGKTWINLYTDLIYSIKGILGGFNTPADVLRSYRSFTEACWDWRDPLPFFMYGLLAWGMLKRR